MAITLLTNVIRRPKVATRVGAPIDIRQLMNIGPTTQPTNDEVRHAADLVMGRLVDLIEDAARRDRARPASACPALAD